MCEGVCERGERECVRLCVREYLRVYERRECVCEGGCVCECEGVRVSKREIEIGEGNRNPGRKLTIVSQ